MTGAGLATRGELAVDLSAIQHNYRWLSRHSEPGRCAAVIKADAYGTGAGPVAQALSQAGCQTFFVADAREGLALRGHLPKAQIMLLDGLHEPDLAALRDAALTPVLTCPEQHRCWQAAGGGSTIWQIDSGMNRLGMSLAEAVALAEQDQPPDLILSHLACADETQNAAHPQQLAKLQQIRRTFADVPLSLGNTAAVQLGKAGSSSLSRCGIGLFGVNPAQPQDDAHYGELRSAVRLRARVLQQRAVPQGAPVGYGASWHAKRPSQLLTAALGYADGIPRRLGNRGSAALDGQALPMVGRISMDYLVLDASDVPAQRRDAARWVDIFADTRALETLATAGDTISYELLASLGSRIKRCYPA